MFSESYHSSDTIEVFAINHCYVDYLCSGDIVSKGEVVFELNKFDIEREVFSIDRDIEMLNYMDKQLEPGYVLDFVLRPIRGILISARKEVAAAEKLLHIALDKKNLGLLGESDIRQAEMDLADRSAAMERANIDLIKKQGEVQRLRARGDSVRASLEHKKLLNQKILDVHSYRAPWRGDLTASTADGCFVERGDIICRISRIK